MQLFRHNVKKPCLQKTNDGSYYIGGVTPDVAEKLTKGIRLSEPQFIAVSVKQGTIV